MAYNGYTMNEISTWQCLSSGSEQNPSSIFPSPFTQWQMSNNWFPGRKPCRVCQFLGWKYTPCKNTANFKPLTWWFWRWSWGRCVPWLMKPAGASSWVPLPFFTLHSWSSKSAHAELSAPSSSSALHAWPHLPFLPYLTLFSRGLSLSNVTVFHCIVVLWLL